MNLRHTLKIEQQQNNNSHTLISLMKSQKSKQIFERPILIQIPIQNM